MALIIDESGRRAKSDRDPLIIEITETAKIHDLDEASRLLSIVRELGCRIALDDFGAGYTSFRQLNSLSLDVVKIDGSIIRGIAQNGESQIFVDDLLVHTTACGIETVAERVEDTVYRNYLLTRGVNYFRGWMYGRPE